MLDEEERDDRTLKDRFTNKWNRTGSKDLTQSIRSEVAKFQGIVETATKVIFFACIQHFIDAQ